MHYEKSTIGFDVGLADIAGNDVCASGHHG